MSSSSTTAATPASSVLPAFSNDITSYSTDTSAIDALSTKKVASWNRKLARIDALVKQLERTGAGNVSKETFTKILDRFISYSPMRKEEIATLSAKYEALRTDRLQRLIIDTSVATRLHRANPDAYKALSGSLDEAMTRDPQDFQKKQDELKALQTKVDASMHKLKGCIDLIARLQVQPKGLWQTTKVYTASLRSAVAGSDPHACAQAALEQRADELAAQKTSASLGALGAGASSSVKDADASDTEEELFPETRGRTNSKESARGSGSVAGDETSPGGG